MTSLPAPGDVVMAPAGTKTRFSVVLSVQAGPPPIVVLCAGYGERYLPQDVEVRQGTRDWIALGLEKTTYFRAKIERLSAGVLQATGRRCPPALFVAIRKSVGMR